jgi:hypothetical protein
MNLFCPFYDEGMWRLSPMNAANNVNGVGTVARTNVYTLDQHGGLLAIQEAMVRKIITELQGFDNLYYEICNEPYFGGVAIEWQRHIAEVISDAEKSLGVRHLISQNIANDKARVENPHPAVSIFNFHYATPPNTVAMNYALDKVIGDNETGFRGTNDSVYRMEAWDFIVAGGGLFNNLDYSFVAGKEDGTFVYPASQPGGGSPLLRRQYQFLSQVLKRFDLVKMRPDSDVVKAELPTGATVRALVNPGRECLVYLRTGLGAKSGELKTGFESGELKLRLELSQGKWEVAWLDPQTGSSLLRKILTLPSSTVTFQVPAFKEDLVLTLHRKPGF